MPTTIETVFDPNNAVHALFLFSPAMSTPSSTDTCQNGRSETLLNNKDEAWQQMSEDSIKPEVNVLSELEDEEDEVKTLQELQSTINRFLTISCPID